MILVERDEDGEVHVSQTGDHLGRKGLGWGGGVGVLVGLAAPPLLASVAVGAAAGGVIGKFLHRKVESGMESGLGEKLKPGTAAIIAMVDDEDRLAAEQALARHAGQVGCRHGQEGRARPQGCPCRGRAQVRPRPQRASHPRSRLRRHDRPLAADIGSRLDDQHDADAARGRPQCLARPHRRRRLRQPEHVRRSHRHAHHDARRPNRPHLRSLPRDGALLADAGGATHRPQPPHRGLRICGRVPGPLPGLHVRRAPRTAHRSCACCRATATAPRASGSGT